MQPSAYLDAIGRHARAMAAAVDTDRHAPVESCPGWDVAALAVHLGYVYRWAAEIVRTRASERIRGEWTFPADDPGLAGWLVEGADELTAVLSDTDPETPMWTMNPPGNAGFWYRRQAIESLIHRWDMESAVGEPSALDPDMAADGVGEYLESLPRRHGRSGVSGAGETYHFHRTDGPGEWFVRFTPQGVEVSAEHAKGDVALRGSAEDLLLVLWRRSPPETLEIFGDPAALRRWFELVAAS